MWLGRTESQIQTNGLEMTSPVSHLGAHRTEMNRPHWKEPPPQLAVSPPTWQRRATPSQKPRLLSHVTDSPAMLVTQTCGTCSPESEETLTFESWFFLQQEPELSNKVQRVFRENSEQFTDISLFFFWNMTYLCPLSTSHLPLPGDAVLWCRSPVWNMSYSSWMAPQTNTAALSSTALSSGTWQWLEYLFQRIVARLKMVIAGKTYIAVSSAKYSLLCGSQCYSHVGSFHVHSLQSPWNRFFPNKKIISPSPVKNGALT